MLHAAAPRPAVESGRAPPTCKPQRSGCTLSAIAGRDRSPGSHCAALWMLKPLRMPRIVRAM
eukprot:178831-Alexandrium_andersonii.AAC.1